MDKLVGWALSYHFMHCSDASVRDSKLLISSERLLYSSLIVFINNVIRKRTLMPINFMHLSMFFVNILLAVLFCSIGYGLNLLQGIQSESKSLKKSLKVKLQMSL